MLRQLCDEAGIDHTDRKIVWYSLRHNLGQSIEEVEDISQAKDQLRHRDLETTKKSYGKSSVESRRNTLEKIYKRASRALDDPAYNPYGDDEPGLPPYENDPTTDSVTTSVESNPGTVHANAYIENTPQARVDFVHRFLDETDDENESEPGEDRE